MTEKEKDEAFEYVLDKVARNALLKLQMNPNDERYVVVVKLVLVNFSELHSDDYLCQYVQRHLEHWNIQLPQEEVQEIVRLTRANCDRQHYAIEVASDQIENDNLGGEEVCNNLSHFLSNSI